MLAMSWVFTWIKRQTGMKPLPLSAPLVLCASTSKSDGTMLTFPAQMGLVSGVLSSCQCPGGQSWVHYPCASASKSQCPSKQSWVDHSCAECRSLGQS